MLEEDQVPSYTTPERVVNAVEALIQYSEAIENLEKRQEEARALSPQRRRIHRTKRCS